MIILNDLFKTPRVYTPWFSLFDVRRHILLKTIVFFATALLRCAWHLLRIASCSWVIKWISCLSQLLKLTRKIRFQGLFVIYFLSKRLFINPCSQHPILKYRKVGGSHQPRWGFNWQIFAPICSHLFDQYHILLQFSNCCWLLAHVSRLPHIDGFDSVGLSHSEFLLHYDLLVEVIFSLNSWNFVIISWII
jgi:hypothetical protein